MQPERGSQIRTVTARGIVDPATATPRRRARVRRDQGAPLRRQHAREDGPAMRENRSAPLSNRRRSKQGRAASSRGPARKDKADLAQAKAAFEHDEAQAKRRTHARKSLLSRKSFERVQTQTTRDEARVAELQASLRTAETNLGDTDIVSPLDGTVVSRNVELGQMVAADSETRPLFVIAADLIAHIGATISAKDSGEVKPGDKATFMIEAFQLSVHWHGRMKRGRRRKQMRTPRRTDVVISAPNTDFLLKPGYGGNDQDRERMTRSLACHFARSRRGISLSKTISTPRSTPMSSISNRWGVAESSNWRFPRMPKVSKGNLLLQRSRALSAAVEQAEADLGVTLGALDTRRPAIATEKSNATIAAEQIKRAQTNLELATRTTDWLGRLRRRPMCRPSNSIKRKRRNVMPRSVFRRRGSRKRRC